MTPNTIEELIEDSWIFLTGITGFVGGCLLERILRYDPGPARIFVLIRKKRGVDPKTRLQEILSSPLFSKVPEKNFSKIQIINGDIKSDNLGISKSDLENLKNRCTHIFHVAAFISFAADLKLAFDINLKGSRTVLKLAKQMKNLKGMVHVSTAYVNCVLNSENQEFNEQVVPLDKEASEILQMIKNLPIDEVINDEKFKNQFKKHPNSYTFTKQLTENLLAQEKGDVPLSIVRPGVILNSLKEPFPGWIDNVNNSACGFIAGAVKGVFRSFHADPNKIVDIIPVDFVVSTILASALKLEQEPNNLKVYHCTSGTINPLTWNEYCKTIVKYSIKHPCKDVAWYPNVKVRSSELRNLIFFIIYQFIPGYFIDFLLKFKKNQVKHSVVEIQNRFLKGSKYTSYFSTKEWHFNRNNTDDLIKLLNDKEIQEYPMDPKIIDWDKYFEICVLGIREYFHKEPSYTTNKARSQMKRLKLMSIVMPFIIYFLIYCFFKCFIGLPMLLATLFTGIFIFIINCL